MPNNTRVGPTPEELKKETQLIIDAIVAIAQGRHTPPIINACASVIMDAASNLPDEGKAAVAKGLANMAQTLINELGEKENG